MMQQHGFMPFVGSGLGPEVGPDMLGKMEAPSWDPSAARIGLADLPDKSQVSFTILMLQLVKNSSMFTRGTQKLVFT
jgi:hypothetical protein